MVTTAAALRAATSQSLRPPQILKFKVSARADTAPAPTAFPAATAEAAFAVESKRAADRAAVAASWVRKVVSALADSARPRRASRFRSRSRALDRLPAAIPLVQPSC